MIISPVMWLSQWLLFHQLCDSPSDGYFTSYVTLNPWVNIILGCVVASPYSLWQERRFQFSHFELSIYNKQHTSSTCIWSTHFSVHSIFQSLCFHLESFWKGLMPTGKLQTQGFLVIKLQLLPRKFYGRHLDFTYYYGMSVSHITTDMFRSPFHRSSTWVRLQMPLVEQELVTLLEHLSWPPVFKWSCSKYLWIVHSWLPIWFSLSFIYLSE